MQHVLAKLSPFFVPSQPIGSSEAFNCLRSNIDNLLSYGLSSILLVRGPSGKSTLISSALQSFSDHKSIASLHTIAINAKYDTIHDTIISIIRVLDPEYLIPKRAAFYTILEVALKLLSSVGPTVFVCKNIDYFAGNDAFLYKLFNTCHAEHRKLCIIVSTADQFLETSLSIRVKSRFTYELINSVRLCTLKLDNYCLLNDPVFLYEVLQLPNLAIDQAKAQVKSTMLTEAQSLLAQTPFHMQLLVTLIFSRLSLSTSSQLLAAENDILAAQGKQQLSEATLAGIIARYNRYIAAILCTTAFIFPVDRLICARTDRRSMVRFADHFFHRLAKGMLLTTVTELTHYFEEEYIEKGVDGTPNERRSICLRGERVHEVTKAAVADSITPSHNNQLFCAIDSLSLEAMHLLGFITMYLKSCPLPEGSTIADPLLSTSFRIEDISTFISSDSKFRFSTAMLKVVSKSFFEITESGLANRVSDGWKLTIPNLLLREYLDSSAGRCKVTGATSALFS